MTNAEIAGLLVEYRKLKARTKEMRTELVRVAVEELGMEQQDAAGMDLAVFLDGYLVGQGMQQGWRNIG